MPRFLIYLFPALIDMVVAGILFVFAVRMADAGKTATSVTAVAAMWALTYMIFSQVAGRITTERNSSAVITGSTILLGISSGCFIFLDQIWFIYPLMILAGIGSAFFFAPFQVFMKTVETSHGAAEGIVRSTALYTFSWSAGFAAGPFVCGFIYQIFGWKACCVLFIALSVITALGIQFLKHYAHGTEGIQHDSSKVVTGYEAMPDLVRLGWIGAGIGIFACVMIRALFPATAVVYELTKSQQGISLALLSITQAFVGLSLIRSRKWMYRPVPLVLFGAAGIAGMILFSIGTSFAVFCAAGICFGIYSGSFFFYFVFHSLVHPEKCGRYVAINESIVGLAGLIGPFVGGILADTVSAGSPYLIFCVPVAGAIIFQAVKTRKAIQTYS